MTNENLELFTAEKARAMSKSYRYLSLDFILKQIKYTAFNGDRTFYLFPNNFNLGLQPKLENLGYKIKYHWFQGGVTISW